MQRGFIKLWRKVYDSPDHPINQSRPFTEFEAWIDLIMLANFEEKEWKGITLKRGELCMSLQSLASRWRWTKSSVNRFLKRNGKRNAIETVSETVTTRITIINYDTYNPSRNAIETVSETQAVRQAKPTKRILKNKELKERNKNTLSDSKENPTAFSQNGYTKNFEAFWQVLPSQMKIGKKNAYKHYKASVKNQEDYDKLKQALENYKRTDRFKRGIIQNGSTWFNNWRDWLEYKETTKKSVKEILDDE